MKGFALTAADREKLMAQGIILRDEPKPDPPKPKLKKRRRSPKRKPRPQPVRKGRGPSANVERILKLAKEGKSGAEISRLIGRHITTVCNHLRDHGQLTWLTWEEVEWLKERRKSQ